MNEINETLPEPHIVERITNLATEKNYQLIRKTQIFPFIDFEGEAETRNNFLTDPVFLNNLNYANEYFRLPSQQKVLSIENYLNSHGCQNPQKLLHKRERFLETLIPLAISIAYQDNAISKRIKFLVRVGDFSTVQELFGNIYLQLIESATTFKWKDDSREKETYAFINYLKRSLLSVVKLKMYEQIEREIDPDFMRIVLQKQSKGFSKTEDAAITLVLAIELKKSLSEQEQKILELMIQGFQKREIIAQLGLTENKYITCRKRIFENTEKIFLTKRQKGTIGSMVIERLFETKGGLLSPREKQVVELLLACPEEVEDRYQHVANQINIGRGTVIKAWSSARLTLLRSKKAQRHGRGEAGKGPPLKKIKLARMILIKNIFSDQEAREEMRRRLSPRHFEIIELSHKRPGLGVKELARKVGCSRHVVSNALGKLENTFPQKYITIMGQI